MTVHQKNTWDWVFKQTPLATILILSIYFQYNYFTKELDKRDVKIEKLESKIDLLEHNLFLKSIK